MLLIPQLVCLKLPDPAVAALLCRDVLFRVHGTGQNRKVQSDNGAVFPDNPALWRHHRVRKDLFQVIKGTVLHTAVDQKLVGIRTEHVADLRIRLAAKLQLGKSKLSVVVSKQRTSLHGRRDWLPAEFKDSRRYVDIFREEGIRLSGGLLSGIFDNQGNFDERIVEMPAFNII